MVAERKGVRRLAEKPSTPEGVPSRSAVEGHEGSSLKDCSLMLFRNGLRQPTGNVASMRRIVFHPLVVKHTK